MITFSKVNTIKVFTEFYQPFLSSFSKILNLTLQSTKERSNGCGYISHKYNIIVTLQSVKSKSYKQRAVEGKEKIFL